MEQFFQDVPGVLRVSAAEPPEEYAGKVRLYSLRYQSDDCEVEGYAAFPLEGWSGAGTYHERLKESYDILQDYWTA